MPTPNDDVSRALPATSSNNQTCPPELVRDQPTSEVSRHLRGEMIPRDLDSQGADAGDGPQERFQTPEAQSVTSPSEQEESSPQTLPDKLDQDSQVFDPRSVSPPTRDGSTTASSTSIPTLTPGSLTATAQTSLTSTGFSRSRLPPNSCSSYLRPGSKFVGTQSGKQQCQVEVDIKHVDMKEWKICGYFRIEGLVKTERYLTTYFEGEIIGPKYTFRTKHESWGASEKQDMTYWERFDQYKTLSKSSKKPDFTCSDCTERDYMFMRWKEYFVVPDHRNKTLPGASFDGFYYICFDQVEGKIDGVYASDSAEKYQQLKLVHVPNRGCFGAMEFR